jgi:hypothetical protein
MFWDFAVRHWVRIGIACDVGAEWPRGREISRELEHGAGAGRICDQVLARRWLRK